jgi:ABC-type uncharacterized transport system permease subunit
MHLLQIILLFIISWPCVRADPKSDKHRRYVKYYRNISDVVCHENEENASFTLVKMFINEFNSTSVNFTEREVNESVKDWKYKLCLTNESYWIVGSFVLTSSLSLLCMGFTLIAYAVSTLNMKSLNGRCLIIHATCMLLQYVFMVNLYSNRLSTDFWAAKTSCVFIRKYYLYMVYII